MLEKYVPANHGGARVARGTSVELKIKTTEGVYGAREGPYYTISQVGPSCPL